MPMAKTLKTKYKLNILLKVFLFFSFKNGQNLFSYLIVEAWAIGAIIECHDRSVVYV